MSKCRTARDSIDHLSVDLSLVQLQDCDINVFAFSRPSIALLPFACLDDLLMPEPASLGGLWRPGSSVGGGKGKGITYSLKSCSALGAISGTTASALAGGNVWVVGCLGHVVCLFVLILFGERSYRWLDILKFEENRS